MDGSTTPEVARTAEVPNRAVTLGRFTDYLTTEPHGGYRRALALKDLIRLGEAESERPAIKKGFIEKLQQEPVTSEFGEEIGSITSTDIMTTRRRLENAGLSERVARARIEGRVQDPKHGDAAQGIEVLRDELVAAYKAEGITDPDEMRDRMLTDLKGILKAYEEQSAQPTT